MDKKPGEVARIKCQVCGFENEVIWTKNRHAMIKCKGAYRGAACGSTLTIGRPGSDELCETCVPVGARLHVLEGMENGAGKQAANDNAGGSGGSGAANDNGKAGGSGKGSGFFASYFDDL